MKITIQIDNYQIERQFNLTPEKFEELFFKSVNFFTKQLKKKTNENHKRKTKIKS